MINMQLAQKKNLSQETINKISKLHKKRESVFRKIESIKPDADSFADLVRKVRSINFELQ